MNNATIVRILVALCLVFLHVICIFLIFMIPDNAAQVTVSVIYGVIMQRVWQWTGSFKINQNNE